jgi:hypothetical protein
MSTRLRLAAALPRLAAAPLRFATAPLRFAAAPLRFAAALALSGCLSACIFGGTGTDTENGITDPTNGKDPNALTGIAARVTDSLGKPLRGVALRLFDPAYRPDLGTAPEAVASNPAESLVTDTGGYARIALNAPGKFVVEGTQNGMTLFFDTLAVPDLKQSAIYTFRARASLAFRGKVKLVSGMRIDTGRVFIRGTGRMCQVDSAGGYDLGLLPVDAGRMGLGVRLVSSPVIVLKATPVKSSALDTAGSFTCNALSEDSAAKTVDPARAAPSEMSISKLDTVRVDSALKACGSLEGGSVISLSGGAATPATGVMTTQPINLLVLTGTSFASYPNSKALDPVLVSFSECVPDAGKDVTTFAVDLRAGSAANDLIVGDVSQKCLVP